MEYTISVLGPDDPDPACDDGGDSGDMGPSMFDRVDVSGTSSAGAIAPGESRLGSLSTLSAQVGGANADVWTLSARAGELLAITLAGDFDPKVFLVSDLLEDDYSDDDGGEGLDSRLCTQIPATGDYDVIVRGFSSTAAGSYTLGVERNPDPGFLHSDLENGRAGVRGTGRPSPAALAMTCGACFRLGRRLVDGLARPAPPSRFRGDPSMRGPFRSWRGRRSHWTSEPRSTPI